MSEQAIRCGNADCSNTIEPQRFGRRRKYCSLSCRQAGFRRGVGRNESPVRYPGSQEHETGHFVTKSPCENNGLQRQKTDLQKASLFWIEVNDVTWKLTDGEISRTPASFGQWGGYNTERGSGVGDQCRLALRKGKLVRAPRRQLIRADQSLDRKASSTRPANWRTSPERR